MRAKAIIAQILSVTMVAALILPVLPPLEVLADEVTKTETIEHVVEHDWEMVNEYGVYEKQSVGGEEWFHIQSGRNDGNGEAGAENAAMILQNDKSEVKDSSTIDITIQLPGSWKTNRFCIYPKYVDEKNWVYVGFNASGWYYQYNVNGESNWAPITGLSNPVDDGTLDLSVSWEENILSIRAGEETASDIQVDALKELSELTGKVALRAGSWGEEYTNVNFRNVTYLNMEGGAEQTWSPLVPREGQVYESVILGGEQVLHLESTEENGGNVEENPAMILDRSQEAFQDGSVEFTVVPKEENTNFGIVFRYSDSSNWGYLGYDSSSKWFYEYSFDGKKGERVTDIGKSQGITSIPEDGMIVKASFEGKNLKVTLDGTEVLDTMVSDTLNKFDKIPAGAIGFKAGTDIETKANTSVDIKDITYTVNHTETIENPEFDAPEEISSEEMTAAIDNKFPRVAGYTLKGELDGKKFYGQTEELTTMVLNRTQNAEGLTVTPTVDFEKVDGHQAKYVMHINEQGIEADITATFMVDGRTLSFDITEIKNINGTIVKTIEIPGHNLISVRSNQRDASFAGSTMSSNTHKNGDTYASVADMTAGKRGYMYAFVSADGLSAGLWSNSENNVTADWQRVTGVVKELTLDNGSKCKEAGLSSTFWTYQKGEAYRAENTAEELPSTKIIITGDENNDAVVDWQDGAISYRSIMNNPLGSEKVPDLVALRIAMNFASQAQNPFLMTLDNAKKVYLNTDGLGQSVLLKGYGSEGHDSGHLNYADIGTRTGGAEDMATLIKEGAKIGTTFGIHVNASETYPESKYFTEDRLKKNADGSLSYGWNWLDQGVNIDADYDLRNGRGQRFKDLKDILDKYNAPLDFIYVDVWGNGQSGDNGTWASRQLAKEITSLGWRVAGEWGYANEYDSTFQHWAADLTYGGYSLKGINSNIARFIRNHQKDSWVGDYPSYGGAAVNPLLGGYDMKDFEGWQGRNDYEGYITNLFDDDLSTKFVQHYQVMKWEDGTPVSMSDNGETYSYTPEMKITLQDEAKANTLVIERQSNDVNDPGYSLRTMTYNDKMIMDGESYLIPWYWDASGNPISSGDEKLYHWNQAGGTSTWEVPAGWNGTVKVYRLTENGKDDGQDVSINNGKITLKAEASVPYVIHKGTSNNAELEWSTGMHLTDSGFNSVDPLGFWKVKESDNVSIVKSAASNNMLQFSGEGSVTQTLTGLEPGQKYAAYVGVDNRSDAKAYIEVKTPGDTQSNYTEKSIANNYVQAYAHNNNAPTIEGGGSYFQNMYVFFTAPKNGKVTLTLSREAGDGNTYYDDIRICEYGAANIVSDNKLKQDFEEVAQGIYPFVVGNVEGVTDNRIHLSEFHAPYTQYGWNDKKVNDVIEGKWSLKSNGLVKRNALLYQTIPQNFRFEPGVTYNVSFDYETGSDDTFALVIGDGDYSTNGYNENYPFEKTGADGIKETPEGIESAVKGDSTGTYKFRLTGSESGQSWIGILSTNTPADTEGVGGGAADFRGYKDFILDNLIIERSGAQKAALEKLVDENSVRYEANYTEKTWKVFSDAMNAAKTALENFDADQEEVDQAAKDLEKAVKGLKVIGSTLTGRVQDESSYLSGITVTAKNKEGYELITVTAGNGSFVIPGLLFGEWVVTAESGSFEPVAKEVTANKENLDLVMDFQLTQAVTNLSGKVTAVGVPAAGVDVNITSGSYSKTVQTGSDGNYSITGIPSRESIITVKLDGYDNYSTTITPVKEKDAVCNIMLQPLSTVDYSNDFSDGKITWENLKGNNSDTTIKAEDGTTKITFPGGHTNVYEMNAPTFKNGYVEMDLTSATPGTRLGILLRAKDMNNRVYVGVCDANDDYFTEYYNGGDSSWSSMHTGEPFTANTKMHLKTEIVDNTVKLWVNNELVVEETMEGMPTEAGAIGLNSREKKVVTVDNLKVVSYDKPEGEVQTMAGKITKDGDPAAGIEVGLYQMAAEEKAEGIFVKSTKTDALGNYKFKNVPFGKYYVEASIDGETLTNEVVVEATEGYIVVEPIKFGSGSSEIVDKSSLQAAYDKVKIYQAEHYMPEGWEVFTTALAHAKAVLDNPGATVLQVIQAETNLNSIASNLVKRPDKSGLQAALEAAAQKEEGNYTPERVYWRMMGLRQKRYVLR